MSKTKVQNKKQTIYAKLKVVGVGGAGGTMIDRLASVNIPAVEYIAINTDIQALDALRSKEIKKIIIGESLTKGLGTGMDPELGRAAIEKEIDKVESALHAADMIFIVGGLGGGTGSGAGPIVAELSKKTKAITLAVVTRPFAFEGVKRKEIAISALEKFKSRVDGLITISNNQILNLTDEKSTLLKAFGIVDDILIHSVSAISDILTVPGLINVDFSDVRSILYGAGSVMVGVGSAHGENRAFKAAQFALENPLIEDFSIKGAKGVLLIVSGSENLAMREVNDIAETVVKQLDSDAKIIFGAVIDENLKDILKVTLIASSSVSALPSLSVSSHIVSPSLSSRATQSKKGGEREIKDRQEKVEAYGDNKEEIEEEQARREKEELQLEEELEIPAFLRKKLK